MPNLSGQSLGRYHILEQLGEGGMAVVYKAYDTRLEQDVAVKVIRIRNLAPSTVPRALIRFEREAKALGKLNHPHIVKVTDYGEFEGQPFLVMPYIPGGTLKQHLSCNPLPWPQAMKLLIPIARALSYAHQQGIIHRDIKPSNILLTESGDPLLTDFGVAKILNEEATIDVTGTNATVGTPDYMAPEQATSKLVDARADVYALGIVLYELVTGRRPFQADTPMAVILKQINDPLPRPSLFVPDLPNPTESILIKALAKRPQDRYQSMADFAAAMEKCLSREATMPVRSRPFPAAGKDSEEQAEASGGRRIATIPSQSRRYAIASLVILPIVLLLGIGYWRFRPRWGIPPAAGVTDSALQTPSVTNPAATITMAPVGPTPTGTAEPTSTPTTIPSRFLGLAVLSIDNADRILELTRMEGSQAQFFSEVASLSRDGSLLASTDGNDIKLWRMADGALLQTLQGHTNWVGSITFSPDGKTLASGSADKTVKLWQVSDGMLLNTFTQHTSIVSSVAFSPDGSILASGSWDNNVILRRVSDGVDIRSLPGHTDSVDCVAFSPDGSILASGSNDSTIEVWQVSTGKLIITLHRHYGCMAFSPDGSLLVSGSSADDTVRVWRISDWALLYTLGGHSDSVTSLAFSPDGTLMASGSGDHTIKVWQMSNGTLLTTLTGHSGTITSLTFSSDGRLLVSGSEDRTIRIWGVK